MYNDLLQRLIEMSYSGRSKALGADLAARSKHITVYGLTCPVSAGIIPVRKNISTIADPAKRSHDGRGNPILPKPDAYILSLELAGSELHSVRDRKTCQGSHHHHKPVLRPHFT